MKQIFIFLTFLIGGTSLWAQDSSTDKGIILIRGESALNYSFSEGSPIDLLIGGGYFVANNIVVGADIGYNSSWEGAGFAVTTFAPFGRYYFKKNFFAGAQYTSLSVEDGDGFAYFSAKAGYAWFLNDYFAVEPTLNFPFKEDVDPSIRVGISVYF